MQVIEGFVIMGGAAAITSIETWFEFAPPKKRSAHWVDGRSAKELARAWCGTGVTAPPAEIIALLDSSHITREGVLTHGIAEHVTRFDGYPGGGRNHDLLLQMRASDDAKIVIGIEAKVDEPLGGTVLGKIDEAKRIIDAGDRTNLQMRVGDLLLALFGRTLDENPTLGNLRYQLLTATAGTLVEAKQRGAAAAVLLIHDLKRGGHRPTQIDTSDFVGALGGADMPVEPGVLYGPMKVPGGGRIPSDVPLYIGLVVATV